MAAAYGAVGFLDDYIKVVKKRNLGLTALQKLVMQFIIVGSYLSSLYYAETTLGGTNATSTLIPFFGRVDLGMFYWPIAAVLIVGMVNAVNLTDGIDGLCTSITFFVAIFSVALILGFFLNGRSFHNYRRLIDCSGYGMDFADKFGMPLCLINFGVYGFCILAYLNVIFWLPTVFPFLPEGVGFTGPTVGVTFAALTFSADGQHPKNVAPIALGYSILFALVCAVCLIAGEKIPWTLSTQAYINGLAFATGLCPIAGSYGFKYGVIAGLVSAIICTSTAAMHGGFVLYNGGFNAGLAAIILIPIFDFYKIMPKKVDDDEVFSIKSRKKKLLSRASTN